MLTKCWGFVQALKRTMDVLLQDQDEAPGPISLASKHPKTAGAGIRYIDDSHNEIDK